VTPTADFQPIDHHAVRPEGRAPKLEPYFRALIKAGGSDLHFKAGSPPHIRVNAVLHATESDELSSEQIEQMAYELMTDEQRAFFQEHGSLDIAHELEGSDRFRLNVYRQRGTVSIAVRRVTREIPDFETLHLPPVLEQVSRQQQGLVLLAGPTGCGKSTTIASMLEYINKRRPCHVVTVEDPIEYIYDDKKAVISQREIGIDVESFESALKYLMREDPDVVLIGEMRDRETFQAALQATETGHLVFGTVHASGAAQTIGRILDLFPSDSRDLIRQSLAFNLQAVICQKLLPSVMEGLDRVPAVEILLTNPSTRQLILEGRDGELPDLIRAHERDGMQSFTMSLLHLIEKDYLDPKVAYEAAPNVDELKMLMKGITAAHAGLIGR
jgi:twitching motility protein PilT